MTFFDIALIAASTTTAVAIIAHVYKVFFSSLKAKEKNGHSEKYIPGNGWAIIDGEFVER